MIIIGLLGNILICVLFWYRELLPLISVFTRGPGEEHPTLYWIKAPFVAVPKVIPFVVDLGITAALLGLFIKGDSLVGSVTGLFASNIVSMIIAWITSRTNLGFWSFTFKFWAGPWKPDAQLPIPQKITSPST